MPIAIGDNWQLVWRPGQPEVRTVEEKTVLRYTINMPPKPPISDLYSREVTIELDGEEQVRTLGPDDPSFQFDADDGTAVVLTLVDVDDNGNRSAPSVPLAFTATDTIPPPAPGGMSVGNVEQI